MLIDGPANRRDIISSRMETLFRDHGMIITPASQRLASFNVVENTYLSVFMILGGLGVIIGTIGLGIVLLRNIALRRQELALYLALGFRRKFIFNLLLAEHTLILALGLVLGLVASLPLIFPLLIYRNSMVPWMLITGILLLILANGFTWIYITASTIMRKDILTGIRDE